MVTLFHPHFRANVSSNAAPSDFVTYLGASVWLPCLLYIRALRVPHIKLTANRIMVPVLCGEYIGVLPFVILVGVIGIVFYTTVKLWDD